MATTIADLVEVDKAGAAIRIVTLKSPSDMDLQASEKILVDSFMHAYEDIPLIELNPTFKSTRDVRRFYQQYFKEELEHFKEGKLLWVEAFSQEKLVGWATFAIEPDDSHAAYMNLLVVAPEHQRQGIGRKLVFSVCSEELFPEITTIHLLIRRVNVGGYAFYRKLGFVESDYERDNFVDPALLTGLTWTRQQATVR